MPDALPPVPAAAPRALTALSPAPATSAAGAALSAAAMSVEDYARVVQARNQFVDFLLAPSRDRLAAAA